MPCSPYQAPEGFQRFAKVPCCTDWKEFHAYRDAKNKVKMSTLCHECFVERAIPASNPWKTAVMKISLRTFSSIPFIALTFSAQTIAKNSLGKAAKGCIYLATAACITAVILKIAIYWRKPKQRHDRSNFHRGFCFPCNQLRRVWKKQNKIEHKYIRHLSNLVTATFFGILFRALKNPQMRLNSGVYESIKPAAKEASLILLGFAVYSAARIYMARREYNALTAKVRKENLYFG